MFYHSLQAYAWKGNKDDDASPTFSTSGLSALKLEFIYTCMIMVHYLSIRSELRGEKWFYFHLLETNKDRIYNCFTLLCLLNSPDLFPAFLTCHTPALLGEEKRESWLVLEMTSTSQDKPHSSMFHLLISAWFLCQKYFTLSASRKTLLIVSDQGLNIF